MSSHTLAFEIDRFLFRLCPFLVWHTRSSVHRMVQEDKDEHESPYDTGKQPLDHRENLHATAMRMLPAQAQSSCAPLSVYALHLTRPFPQYATFN